LPNLSGRQDQYLKFCIIRFANQIFLLLQNFIQNV
jgi:hypothetical protein